MASNFSEGTEMSDSTANSNVFPETTRFQVQAVLFDLDGTLLDSTIATERAWHTWAEQLGIEDYRHTAHGVTAQDLVAQLIAPASRDEALKLINRLEVKDTEGVRIKEGVGGLLNEVPAERWTIVTSCTRELALARMGAAHLAEPEHMVTADQVKTGKPSPEGYLLAAERLGVDISQCLVVEDAPAGVDAGAAAGAKTLAVTGTYGAQQLEADMVVQSLEQVRITTSATGALLIEIDA